MDTKTVAVFGATGAAGAACVNAFIEDDLFSVKVLARQSGQKEVSSSAMGKDQQEKQALYDQWERKGVTISYVDETSADSLIPALRGTDYVVSCVPIYATESQFPLIWAAREAGVERFIPSEYGAIYEFEQFWQTDTCHRSMARQKAFIRRVIEMSGMDFTIIPAGAWIEYYMMEPVLIAGDPNAKVAWSTARDVGRIIPRVLAHPASRNAICPVAATAWCSWNELLDAREKALGRKVVREAWPAEQWRMAYEQQPPGNIKTLMAIGVAVADTPDGMSLFGNWNKTFIPDFQGTPLDDLFINYVEPFVAETRTALIASGEIPG